MMRKKNKIIIYILVTVYLFLILMTLTGCGASSTMMTTTISDNKNKEVQVQKMSQIELVRDSVVYREKIRNDTVYLEILKEKTKIVHDTSYIYFAVSDTVYTVKYDKVIKEKLIKETPWYNYCIIIMLVMIILYLLICKFFKS